ncbi:BACON domain-containing protein [Spirosoma arcticum]
MKRTIYTGLVAAILGLSPALAQTETFNYKEYTTGLASTFGIRVQSIDRTTGAITINTAIDDNRRNSSVPLTFIWGDNTPNTIGYFPQTHTYASITQNQLVRTVATFKDNQKDTAEVFVNFIKPKVSPISTDPKFKVTIPNQVVSLPIRNSTGFFTRSYFNDDHFKGPFTRAEIEYILTVGNSIEFDLANGNVYQFNGKVEQYMLRDPDFGGGYAVDYTNPFSFYMNDRYVNGSQEPIGFSSLMHEMGHNMTTTMPADFLIGPKVGGPGGAIYIETMAQIFQHAVGYEMVNNPEKYGLDAVATNILRTEFLSSFRQLSYFYQQYVDKGMNYQTWVDSQNSYEIITYTFGTAGYKFCEYAENQGLGYRIPTKRLTQFLQRFNAEWEKRYDRLNNTSAANSFRATMMVAAISHAFQKDLRADFRALKFPVSDADWAFLNPALLDVSTNALSLSSIASNASSFSVTSTATSWSVASSQPWLTPSMNSGSGNQVLTLAAAANSSITSRTAVVTIAAAGFVDRTITVVQAGAAPTLATSTQSLSLAASAGPTSVTITSNTSWSVVSSQSWLTTITSSGAGGQVLSVSATANALAAPRSATLTVSANGVPSQFVVVTQTGAPAALAVSVTSLTVEATSGTPSVDITSNASWSVTSSQPWLSASPASGSGNVTLALTAGANTVVESRTATLTISANGTANQMVSVVQRGILITAVASALDESLRIYPNPATNLVTIEGLLPQSTVLLYDAWGRLLHQQISTSARHPLATDNLPAGTYYLRVQSKQKTAGQRFLKRP